MTSHKSSAKAGSSIIDWAACRLGYPRTHLEYRDGINTQICNHCDRKIRLTGEMSREVSEAEAVAEAEEFVRSFVQRTERDDWHYVQIDCEWERFRFICEAPEGSPCRMLPQCQHTGGGCVEYEGGHAIVCTAKDRVLVDTGECTIKPWIDDGDGCGRGEFSIPVTTGWADDCWQWRPVVREE